MCQHERFLIDYTVTKTADKKLILVMSLYCTECKKSFMFNGVPSGFSKDHPTTDREGTQLRIYIK